MMEFYAFLVQRFRVRVSSLIHEQEMQQRTLSAPHLRRLLQQNLFSLGVILEQRSPLLIPSHLHDSIWRGDNASTVWAWNRSLPCISNICLSDAVNLRHIVRHDVPSDRTLRDRPCSGDYLSLAYFSFVPLSKLNLFILIVCVSEPFISVRIYIEPEHVCIWEYY